MTELDFRGFFNELEDARMGRLRASDCEVQTVKYQQPGKIQQVEKQEVTSVTANYFVQHYKRRTENLCDCLNDLAQAIFWVGGVALALLLTCFQYIPPFANVPLIIALVILIIASLYCTRLLRRPNSPPLPSYVFHDNQPVLLGIPSYKCTDGNAFVRYFIGDGEVVLKVVDRLGANGWNSTTVTMNQSAAFHEISLLEGAEKAALALPSVMIKRWGE